MFAATIFHYYAQNYTICGMDLCIFIHHRILKLVQVLEAVLNFSKKFFLA